MKRLLLTVLVGCLLPALAQAQDSFITGQIRHPGGSPVPSIRVSLARVDAINGVSFLNLSPVFTNSDGVFRFNQVSPGRYVVYTAAFTVTILPETSDAAQAIVYTSRAPFILPGSGTFFPGTTDVNEAEVVTVVAGSSNRNIDFVLAPGAAPWSDPSLRALRGRIVVEDGSTPSVSSDRFGLFLSDGPGGRATEVTFIDGPRKPARPTTWLESTPFQMVTSFVPMPAFPDGNFQVFVRAGAYRVGQLAPAAGAGANHTQGEAYYVKAISFEGTNLMKELMRIQGPPASELVVTLAKCTAETQDPMCR